VPAGSLVVAGDFNIAPEDRYVYDPAAFAGSTHVTPEERAAHRALLATGLRHRTRLPQGRKPSDHAPLVADLA
jgi:exodeoxyribonuclease III